MQEMGKVIAALVAVLMAALLVLAIVMVLDGIARVVA